MADEILRIVSSKIVYTLEDGSSFATKPKAIRNMIYNVDTDKVIDIHAQSQDIIQLR